MALRIASFAALQLRPWQPLIRFLHCDGHFTSDRCIASKPALIFAQFWCWLLINQANLRNPLRWYLLALFIGFLLSLGVGDPFQKFQIQRFAELLPALGLLAWCYRQQPREFFTEPAIGGWYGLGLVGFAFSTLVAGISGPIPWISLGFLGLVLLQFGLLPLLQPVWQRFGGDSIRVLALFGVALLGIDVGILLIARIGELVPYSWVVRSSGGGLDEFPYLFLNSRWANQAALLLVWVFVPLLRQLYLREIKRQRWFWWTICFAMPLLAAIQFIFTSGRGALLASALAVLSLWCWSGWSRGHDRQILRLGVLVVLVSVLLALLLNVVVAQGEFFSAAALRNAQDVGLAPAGADRRSVLLPAFLRGIWLEVFRGQGIPLVAPGAPACTPHNLWLALLFWTGLVGTAFAGLLATGFVPRRLAYTGHRMMVLPLLVTLVVYPLVDDLWLRALPLALLLVLLPAFKQPDAQSVSVYQSRWFRSFVFPLSTYRLLALSGVLLISLSVVVPGGVGFGPSSAVAVPGRTCMLFF